MPSSWFVTSRIQPMFSFCHKQLKSTSVNLLTDHKIFLGSLCNCSKHISFTYILHVATKCYTLLPSYMFKKEIDATVICSLVYVIVWVHHWFLRKCVWWARVLLEASYRSDASHLLLLVVLTHQSQPSQNAPPPCTPQRQTQGSPWNINSIG